MKLADVLKLIETAIADAAIIEQAIGAIVHGLGERTQPQAQIQGDVAVIHKGHAELVSALQSSHVEIARAAGVASPYEPPADPAAVPAVEPAAAPKKRRAAKKP